MQNSYHVDRGQPQQRPAPIPGPAFYQGAMGGRSPPMPAVVQQRPMPHPAGPFPPHPPRDIIPPQLHRSVVVSDIRPEIQTEDDIREQLSDYIILRFEKVEPYDEYDSEGEEVKSTWDNCVRRRLPDVDKADARREIRRLNREDAKKGRTFLEKQNSLGPKGQNQLAKAQRELSSEERDERFHTVLAQIDSRLKPVVEKHVKVTRHRSNTKRKIRQKKKYERTSITAYFKHCPKPNQVPSELARRMELEKQQFRQRQEQQQVEMMQLRQRQMQAQQMPPQRPQVVPHHHPGSMPSPQADQMNRPGPPLPHQQVAHMNRPQAMPMHQHNAAHGAGRPHTPIQVIHEASKRDKHHRRVHSSDSDSSEYSDVGSDSEVESQSTLITVPSHSSGSHKGKRDHGHKRRSFRYLENPESFGIEVHPARRHGLLEEKSYILTGSGMRIPIAQVPVPPREAAIPVENIEQLRVDAYHAGRNDQKAEYLQRLDETKNLDTACRRYQPRYAPRPEIVLDRGSPRIRHVTPSEVNRQLDDSFQRLRLGRGLLYHDGFDDLVHRDGQRRRKAVAREEQEHTMKGFEEQEARERRRGESPTPLLNPLSRRSANAAYDFERDLRR